MSPARQQRLLPPSPTPQIIAVPGQKHDEEVRKLEETGYVILGEATFSGDGVATKQQLIEHAKQVGADIVIHSSDLSHTEQGSIPITTYQPGQTYTTLHSGTIYGQGYASYSGTSTTTTPGTLVTDHVPYQRRHYRYLATFWRRTRPPILGATLTSLPDSTRAALQRNTGAYVALVVIDSPAFKANILKGDVIVQFASKPVDSFQEVFDLLPTLAGEKVTAQVIRGTQTLNVDIQLNQ